MQIAFRIVQIRQHRPLIVLYLFRIPLKLSPIGITEISLCRQGQYTEHSGVVSEGCICYYSLNMVLVWFFHKKAVPLRHFSLCIISYGAVL